MAAEQHLKLLDCDRKGILALPSGAVHVWLCYYMHESDAQEAYLSVRTLARVTELDPKTVNKWQKYLLEHGWLVRVGATAADRYSRPTRGANKVPVVRVDDPIKGVGIIATGVLENLLHPKIPTKVYGSSSGSGSSSESSCDSTCNAIVRETVASLPTLPSVEEEPAKQKPKATPKPTTPVAPPVSATPIQDKRKKAAKDGTPYPPDFNSWSNVARCEWLAAHAAAKPEEAPVAKRAGEQAPVEPDWEPSQEPSVTAPPPKAAPPAPAMLESPKQSEGSPMSNEARKAIRAAMDEVNSDVDDAPLALRRPKTEHEIKEEEFCRDWDAHWSAVKSEKLMNMEHEDSRLNTVIKDHVRIDFRKQWEHERMEDRLRALGFR